MVYRYEHSATSHSSVGRAWKVISDFIQWPKFDPDCESAGPKNQDETKLYVGQDIWVQMNRGRGKHECVVDSVNAPADDKATSAGFSYIFKLPLKTGQMRFIYEVNQLNSKTISVTQATEISGALTPIYKLAFKKSIEHGAQVISDRVAQMAAQMGNL